MSRIFSVYEHGDLGYTHNMSSRRARSARPIAALTGLVLAAILVGCSSSGDDSQASEPDAEADLDHELCFGDEVELVEGLTLAGDAQNFKVRVLSWDPDPLAVGNNSITILVTDMNDTPVDGVSFDLLETWQRIHDHGTPIVPEAVAGSTTGEWVVSKLNVLHRGSWLFRFGVSAGESSDLVEFNFGVDCQQFVPQE